MFFLVGKLYRNWEEKPDLGLFLKHIFNSFDIIKQSAFQGIINI